MLVSSRPANAIYFKFRSHVLAAYHGYNFTMSQGQSTSFMQQAIWPVSLATPYTIITISPLYHDAVIGSCFSVVNDPIDLIHACHHCCCCSWWPCSFHCDYDEIMKTCEGVLLVNNLILLVLTSIDRCSSCRYVQTMMIVIVDRVESITKWRIE